MEGLHEVLRKIRELPQGQQNLFSIDRKTSMLAADEYASRETPKSFDELYRDIVVVSVQLCYSAFKAKNSDLFIHLLPDLKHCKHLVTMMVKTDVWMHSKLANSNKDLKELRSIRVRMQQAVHHLRYLARLKGIESWRKGDRSPLIARFVTAKDLEEKDREEFRTVFPTAVPEQSTAPRQTARCVNVSEALRVGRREINAFACKQSELSLYSLEWFADQVLSDTERLNKFAYFTDLLCKPVAEEDAMLRMFSAVGSIRLAQNTAKLHDFSDCATELFSGRMNRRKQICHAEVVAGYINETSENRAYHCLSDLVEDVQAIATGTNRALFFARRVLRKIHPKVGLNRLLFLILHKRNAVWMLALLSCCALDDYRRARILRFLFLFTSSTEPSTTTTVYNQMELLLLCGSITAVGTAFMQEPDASTKSNAYTLLKLYTTTQAGAANVFENMIVQRNLLNPSAWKPIVQMRSHVLCRGDVERILAFMYAVCPHPWTKNRNALYLPNELVRLVATWLSTMHTGTHFVPGEEVGANVFIQQHPY